MTREFQKKIEVFYAEEACKALKTYWEVKPSPNEQNWPDLIITAKDKSFGLEVRELYLDETKKGSLQKSKEVLNNKIIQKIASDYYKDNTSPVSVNILGDLSDEKKILKSIVIKARNLSVFEHVRVKPYSGCTVFITKVPEELKEYKRGWTYISDKVGWVRYIEEDTLERVINLKSVNLHKYKSNCNDVRLLLVGNRRFNSGLFNYRGGVEIDKKGFNTIYFFSYPDSIEEF